VLTEALQNVVDHAYPRDSVARDGGLVVVELANDDGWLSVRVTDDGVGVPADFALEQVSGLGLSIVRTLVTSELGGTIEIVRGEGSSERPGTVVAIRVPADSEREADAPRPPDEGGR